MQYDLAVDELLEIRNMPDGTKWRMIGHIGISLIPNMASGMVISTVTVVFQSH